MKPRLLQGHGHPHPRRGDGPRNKASMDSTAVVEIKSKFEFEFRRLSLLRRQAEALSIDAFYRLITDTHRLPPLASVQILYLDPRKNEQVPIDDAKELATAFKGAAPLLRLFVNRVRGAEVEVSKPYSHADAHETRVASHLQ